MERSITPQATGSMGPPAWMGCRSDRRTRGPPIRERVHEGPWLRAGHVPGFDGIDFEPSRADQAVHIAIEVTAPADPLPTISNDACQGLLGFSVTIRVGWHLIDRPP